MAVQSPAFAVEKGVRMSAIMLTIKRFLENLVSFFRGGAEMGGLDPSDLTEAVLEAAKKSAKNWGDELDIPNAYKVHISLSDWDAYYGSRVRLTEERLEAALGRFVSEVGASMDKPTVSVEEDGNVPAGKVQVHASFGDSSSLGTTPVFSWWDKRNPGDAVRRIKDSASESASTPEVTDVGSVTPQVTSPEAVTPIRERVPFVSVPDGKRFDVADGSTIGIARDASRELPTISLPYAEGLRYCSQVHGQFSKGEEGWFFTDTSLNGTRVLRGSDQLQLDASPFALEDNDMLFFGDSDVSAVVFHSEVA